MPNEPEPRDAQLEEIVAYLDGELLPEDCGRVERRLASDEDYRRQLQSVERAWNALDELPLPTVDDKFSRSTMTMAVKAAAEEVRGKTLALPIIQRRRRLSTVLAATIAAAALGFLVCRLAWRNPNAALVADLPVIENLDIYTQVHDAAFLRSLRMAMGSQFDALAGESNDLPAREERFQTVADWKNRDAWLRNLTPAEQTNLQARFRRFGELSPEAKDGLRDLNEELMAPRADELRNTMLTYQEWLRGLPPDRQFELRSMNTADRIDTIKRWSAEMRDDSLFALSEKELETLFVALRAPLADIRHSVTRNVEANPNRPKRDRDNDRDKNRERGRDRPGDFFSQPFVMYRRELTNRMEPKSGDADGFYQALVAALPERTREPFEALQQRDEVEQFLTWMRQYATSIGDVSQQDLERFFSEELDTKTQAELLSLPPGEMEQSLRWRYRRQLNAGFPARWMPGSPGGRNGWDGPWTEGPGPRRGPDGPPGEFGPPHGPQNGPPPFGPPDDRRRDFRGPRHEGPPGEFGPPRGEGRGGPPPRRPRPPGEGPGPEGMRPPEEEDGPPPPN